MSRYYDWLDSVTPEEFPDRPRPDLDEDHPVSTVKVRPMSPEQFDAAVERVQIRCGYIRLMIKQAS